MMSTSILSSGAPSGNSTPKFSSRKACSAGVAGGMSILRCDVSRSALTEPVMPAENRTTAAESRRERPRGRAAIAPAARKSMRARRQSPAAGFVLLFAFSDAGDGFI